MRAAGGRYDPLPVDQAIAYVIEILPAFQYLHDMGLVYCDFKPDNIIQVGDAVKLIDMGGVRRIDDLDSPIYGTVGYQAPEVPQVGTSVASDIYTIGRTLMVLAIEFRGYQSTYVASLPPVSATPLFQQHDSLYRLLAKACAPDPADRFASADELRVQLLGVLREVVAARDAEGGAAQHSTSSLLFESPTVTDEPLGWGHLPALRVDEADPQAGWLRTVSVDDPGARLALLQSAPRSSPEVLLATGRAALEAGRTDVVAAAVRDMLGADPWEWRAVWLSGLASLATDDAAGAQAAFNAVYGQVPGELAPKLGAGAGLRDQRRARRRRVAVCDLRTHRRQLHRARRLRPGPDPRHPRRPRRRARRPGPRAADQPGVSLGPPPAGRAAGRLGPGLPALAEAMGSIESLTIEPRERASLAVDVLQAALTQVLADGPEPDISIAGRPAVEPALRDGLEAAYRDLAGHTPTRSERVDLVDRANAVRRWSLR